MYSTHKEGKSAVAERFIRTLKIIYKCMTSISKNVYINKLDEIVNKYNNIYHRTIEPSIFTDFHLENNKEGPKFNVCDHVRIWKYKNIFAKGYVPNWSEKVFVITKFKNPFDEEEIIGTFYIKELQKNKSKRV